MGSANNLKVIVGEHDKTVADGEESFSVCNKIEHPLYNSLTNENDIAILKLCSPINFRREVSPICLPSLPGGAYDDVLATVSGWGSLQSGGSTARKLMEVNVTTMTNNKCGEQYGDYATITSDMICASGRGKDACQGDSGGPLFTYELDSFYSLIGVVSWGFGCADPEFPGVYSRVTENLDFVKNNMGGATCGVPTSASSTSVPLTTTISTEMPVSMTSTTEEPSTSETPGPVTTTSASSLSTEEPISSTSEASTCSCGVPNRATRIVGGVVTEVNEYPWQVGLVSSFGSKPYCGGSILSSKTILTAAHCTENSQASDIIVVIAEHDWTISDGEERIQVCSKKEHPNYDTDSTDHDYSILTLCKEIKFRKEASPVCLPMRTSSAYDSVTATVSGWGTLSSGGSQPDELNEVDVTTMTNTVCKSKYGSSAITDSMICAADSGKDACQGDSGGPLVTMEAGNFYSLIGVVSWGFGCASPSFPGVYARVTYVKSFIEDNISGSTCPPPPTP